MLRQDMLRQDYHRAAWIYVPYSSCCFC